MTNEVERLVMLPLPDGMQRMESGPVQFGDDWPGIFLRGDEALHLAYVIDHAAAGAAGSGDVLFSQYLQSAAKALRKCKAT